jgi:hypothetical protein
MALSIMDLIVTLSIMTLSMSIINMLYAIMLNVVMLTVVSPYRNPTLTMIVRDS